MSENGNSKNHEEIGVVESEEKNLVHELTEDEAALYDRQIRLWGVDAQRKLLNSRVLVINMNGLASEIAKNIVLGGINSITILDPNDVTEKDLRINFLLDRNSLGKNRAKSCIEQLQILNPLVKVNADCSPIDSKDSTYFSKTNFDIVCALLNDNHEQIVEINELCRKNNVYFICGYVYGIHGYMFVDLNNYKYICEVPKVFEDETGNTIDEKLKERADARKSEKEHVLANKETNFVSYAKFVESFKEYFKGLTPRKAKRLSKAFYITIIMFLFRDKYKRDLTEKSDKELFIELKKEFFEKNNLTQELLDDFYVDQIIGETCPGNAIVGGIIGQEILKSLSQNKEPIENIFVFEGDAMSGVVEKIGY